MMSSTHHNTWVLVTDSAICRLYDYNRNPEQLVLVKEIKHPENRLKDTDLTSDRPGHFKSGANNRGSFSQETDPKEVKIEEFARDIDKVLDHGRVTQAFTKLIIIAPPHMSGLLFQHINKHVKELVTHSIKKDIPNLAERELLAFLHKHTGHQTN
jgi:protein required for attachment to host cells